MGISTQFRAMGANTVENIEKRYGWDSKQQMSPSPDTIDVNKHNQTSRYELHQFSMKSKITWKSECKTWLEIILEKAIPNDRMSFNVLGVQCSVFIVVYMLCTMFSVL